MPIMVEKLVLLNRVDGPDDGSGSDIWGKNSDPIFEKNSGTWSDHPEIPGSATILFNLSYNGGGGLYVPTIFYLFFY